MKFAALSAALALVAATILVASGFSRLGGVMDLVSKPVMTGFLFGLGLTVAMSQLPRIFGVPAGSGNFFPRLADLVRDLDETSWWTLAVGSASVGALVLLGRLAPRVPAMLVVLAGSIVVSALLDLQSHGVAVVGSLPSALPDPSVPDVGWDDLVDLLPAALGMLILSAEAAGVSRAIAGTDGYRVDVNRDLVALGGSNLLAGLSGGFVQSGGASQTLAGERAGGKTQLSSLITAGIVLLTGAFLTSLFKDLPEAALAAIVVVAISGFFRIDELARFRRVSSAASPWSSPWCSSRRGGAVGGPPGRRRSHPVPQVCDSPRTPPWSRPRLPPWSRPDWAAPRWKVRPRCGRCWRPAAGPSARSGSPTTSSRPCGPSSAPWPSGDGCPSARDAGRARRCP